MSQSYRIVWEIEIDADTPKEAAEAALAVQRRTGSHAIVFDVTDEAGKQVRVDLLDYDVEEGPGDGLQCSECNSDLPDQPIQGWNADGLFCSEKCAEAYKAKNYTHYVAAIGDKVIHHKDGNPSNNELSNLEIVTLGQNVAKPASCPRCGATRIAYYGSDFYSCECGWDSIMQPLAVPNV
jgi:hypothetical protein